ncbi:MAG TPA: DUF167 domain-containing protein [Opitutaceae bacterium]|nr:DUF167 domain-containing protein [Opitutaceae bacterium]
MPPSCRLAVKAIPNAPRDAIAGWIGGALKVKVRAPALGGRANGAVCELMARELGLPKSAVRVVQGSRSRSKVLEILGLTPAEASSRLGDSARP